MNFFRVEAWERKGFIAHGFGTRGKPGENSSRKDWRGKTVRERKKAFPLVSIRQVHGASVIVFEGEPPMPEELWLKEGDALITRIPGYALGVFTADCLPLLLYDPVQRAVGIVHVGWRGTARAISQKAIEKMTETFNCHSENILAAMGPCIGPCCYEVDHPVRESFVTGGLPWELMSSVRGKGRWSLDLQQANIYLLESVGVKRGNIHLVEVCTSCRRDIFHSYRAEGKTRNGQLNFIALRERV